MDFRPNYRKEHLTMKNAFVEVALSNVAYDETYHQAIDLTPATPVVRKILSENGVNQTKLDLNQVKKIVFRGESKYAVTIPYKKEATPTENESCFVFLSFHCSTPF